MTNACRCAVGSDARVAPATARVRSGCAVSRCRATARRARRHPARWRSPAHNRPVRCRGCTAARRRPERPRLRRSDRRGWAWPRGRRGAVDQALGDGEQRLARAADRQHLTRRIDGAGRQAVALHQPVGNGGAQRVRTGGFRVAAQAVQVGDQGVAYQRRRRVARLADGKIHQRQAGRRREIGQQGAQTLERVRLQGVETGIHAMSLRPCGGFWSRRCTRS